MNKQEIIDHVINRTNWEMMAELRIIASRAKALQSDWLNSPEALKQLGTELLTGMLDKDLDSVSSGMLAAYKIEHDNDFVEYGVRFEAETDEAVAYVENGILCPDEDEDDQWADVIIH